MNKHTIDYRVAESDAAQSELFDVVIIGAGITGTCLFYQLRARGFRVLLADKSRLCGSDFFQKHK